VAIEGARGKQGGFRLLAQRIVSLGNPVFSLRLIVYEFQAGRLPPIQRKAWEALRESERTAAGKNSQKSDRSNTGDTNLSYHCQKDFCTTVQKRREQKTGCLRRLISRDRMSAAVRSYQTLAICQKRRRRGGNLWDRPQKYRPNKI